MLKVVLAGGSGFVGRRLVRRLVARGDDVAVLAREPRAARATLAPGARVLRWSLDPGPERDAWEREVDAAGAVVNLAGAGIMDRPWTPARKRELVASRVDVTLALAGAMARRASEPRVLVSASAVGVYGMRSDDTVLTEDAPPGTDFLADLCVRWEEAADAARDAGIRVVHPRLGIVLGRDGGALAAMVRPFRLHAGGPLGPGNQWVSWVHERDVVGALELALDTVGLSGPCNLVAPRPVTMNEEAQALATALGTHARARVPAFALTALLGAERAAVILSGQRASAGRLLAAGYAFAFPEILPALRDLLEHP